MAHDKKTDAPIELDGLERNEAVELDSSSLIDEDDEVTRDTSFGGAAADLANLPIPKRASPLDGAVAPKAKRPDLSKIPDLPLPKKRNEKAPPTTHGLGGPTPAPAPRHTHLGLGEDLLAPHEEHSDGAPASVQRPVPPRGTVMGLPDSPLPGIDKPTPKGITDLPTPKGITDLPTPKGITDLPTPRGITDLPTPRGITDLPTPKGIIDLPTPKGITDLPTPKGITDLPTAKTVPGPTKPRPPGLGQAIKPPVKRPSADDFFELDDGGPTRGSPPVLDLANDDALELGTAGLGPSPGIKDLGGLELGDAIDQLDLGSAPLDLGSAGALELGSSPWDLGNAPLELGSSAPLDLGEPSLELDDPNLNALELGNAPLELGSSGPLDLGEPSLELGGSNLDALELESPAGSSSSSYGDASDVDVVTFAPPGSTQTIDKGTGGPPVSDVLELDQAAIASAEAGKKRTTFRASGKASAAEGEKQEKSPGRVKALWMATAAGMTLALGGGGFYLWQQRAAAQEQADAAARTMRAASAALADDRPDHWDQATKALEGFLLREKNHGDASAMLAEAHFAAAFDTGIGLEDRLKEGAEALREAQKHGASAERLGKARALQHLVEARADAAQKELEGVAKRDNRDGALQLYLGWAFAEQHLPVRAIAAFDEALKITPDRLQVLYGKALAHLELGQSTEARQLFEATINRSKEQYNRDHFGALVGAAQLAQVDRFSDRENRYLEILRHERLNEANPSAISRAWSLAGDEALKGARLDVAQERYATALALDRSNADAMAGQAKVLKARGKLDAAAKQLKTVLQLQPKHLDAVLTLSALALARDRIDLADDHLQSALNRKPAVEDPATRGRMQGLLGDILAKKNDKAGAEEAYRSAVDLAGETDIQPLLSLASLLVEQGRGAEALSLLAPVRDKATTDPVTAVRLGVAYATGGDAASAVPFFRTAVRLRPKDPEARAQLGRAYYRMGQVDDAVAELERAYEDGEKREDIGLELASIYEQRADYDRASALYDAIVTRPNPSLGAQGAAGRFFARRGNAMRAQQIGSALRQSQPNDAAGIFLAGISLLAEKKPAEALDKFDEAIRIDPQSQYQSAAGLAAEQGENHEVALLRYENAIKSDPDFLEPRLGIIRIRIKTRSFNLALKELEAAKEIAERADSNHESIRRRAEIRSMEGFAYLEQRDFAAAVRSLKAALQIDSQQPYSYYLLGRAYGDLGKTSDSASAFRAAVRSIDEDETEDWAADAFRRLGYAERERGDRNGAVIAFRRFLELADKENRHVGEVRRLLVGMRGR